MSDLWIMVTIHSIHYVDKSALVVYENQTYSISLNDPIQQTDIAANVICVPTYVLKPRDHYSELLVDNYVKRMMDDWQSQA